MLTSSECIKCPPAYTPWSRLYAMPSHSDVVPPYLPPNTQHNSVWMLPSGLPGLVDTPATLHFIALHVQRFLMNAVGHGLAGYFDQKRFPSGHNATQFLLWYSQNADYFITYKER